MKKNLIVMVLVVVMALVVVAPKAGAVDRITISGGTTWSCMGQYAQVAKKWYDGPAVTYGYWSFDDETGVKDGFTAYMELTIDDEVVEVPFTTLEYNDFMQWLDEFDRYLSDNYFECYHAMSMFMGTW